MHFIIDDKIPYIEGVLEPFGTVKYLSGKETTPEEVKKADALITRTRTPCDREHLEGSNVKMIATATIGFDHIDTQFCKENNIVWQNAPGCNAASVGQYMGALYSYLSNKYQLDFENLTVGIVGVGNTGKQSLRMANIFGLKTLLNDPPRQKSEDLPHFVSLEKIKQEADIIVFHTPLVRDGETPTLHLADQHFFNTLGKTPIIVNACRGEVIDNQALKQAMKEKKVSHVILDCWENEPNIDLELLDSVELGSCHIAGYAKDSKANGTSMSIQALSKFFNLGLDNWKPTNVETPKNEFISLDGQGKSTLDIIKEAILATYPIWEDFEILKNAPHLFEKHRGDYGVRRDFYAHTIQGKNLTEEMILKLKEIGFSGL